MEYAPGDRFTFIWGSKTDRPEQHDWEVLAVVLRDWIVYRRKPKGKGHHWRDPQIAHVTYSDLSLDAGTLKPRKNSPFESRNQPCGAR
jgi:hypothetical protein